MVSDSIECGSINLPAFFRHWLRFFSWQSLKREKLKDQQIVDLVMGWMLSKSHVGRSELFLFITDPFLGVLSLHKRIKIARCRCLTKKDLILITKAETLT